jgi:hypothetical protein
MDVTYMVSLSASTEEELHILGSELLHGDLIVVNGPVNHVCFLLLQHYHTRFNRVLDAETSYGARTLLPNTMASIS